MARFVVLDHSLTRVGGHHYEHATQILQAVDSRGYEPVLVTNRRFSQQHLLPKHWQAFALFPDESYDCQSHYPLDIEGASLGTGGLASESAVAGRSLADRWRHMRRHLAQRQRRRRIARFAAACSRLEERVNLRDGDQVFIPTTSLFDLLGIIRFLHTLSSTPHVVWHALFHYGFLQGREPEYAQQSEKERKISRQLHYLVDNVPAGELRFYATTEKLARQFNRLHVTTFLELPFPVDNVALARERSENAPPLLRLTCAGFLRREKGKIWANKLVQGLWQAELESGHVQLMVQTNRRQARRMLPPRLQIPCVSDRICTV